MIRKLLFGACLISVLAATSCSETPATKTEQATSAKPYREVLRLSGNGVKKSETFTLSGNAARLRYEYQGDKDLNMGAFAAYVVDKGTDINEEGGAPDVMTQAATDKSETSLQKDAGEYYLNVEAVGTWSVIVEEQQ